MNLITFAFRKKEKLLNSIVKGFIQIVCVCRGVCVCVGGGGCNSFQNKRSNYKWIHLFVNAK